MSEFTPGPWRLSSDERVIIANDGVASTICQCPDNQLYASVRWLFNARLITAAPDLLGLLIELIDIEGPLPGNVEWARKVQAAIAKATGESE